jgi:glutamine synthetase
MTNEEIIDKIRAGDSSKIKFAVSDIDGVLRGKIIHREKFFQGLDSGFGFCDVIFGWDANDEAYDNTTVTGWHTGYPDAQLRLDISTYRTIPWEDNIPFFLGDFSKDSTLEPVCPRTLLKKIQKQCVDMGYMPLFTQEFEWFNFKKGVQPPGEKEYQNPQPLTQGMFGYSILRPSMNSAYFNDLFDLLEKFRVPLEGLHTETGPGVYEACTQPQEILEAADQATLFKTAVKEIAYRHGIIASFMAKWNMHLPGCSGHIHQSLWNKQQDTNLFVNVNDKDGVSELMKSYVAGQLKCMPYILPVYAPTVNSYKRLVEGAWAPTTVTWGIDNRTTALRVLNVTPKLTRLETRVPGSDTNPFLAMAASLASGLYGIKNNLKLDVVPTEGNGYKDIRNGKLATNLKEATALMRNSEIANSLFGEAFVDHFTRTRDWEWRQFSKHVTDWELKQYFEVI